MTHDYKLNEIVKYAEKNGFSFDPYPFDEAYWIRPMDYYEVIIFSHSFLKAFFGEERTTYRFDSFQVFKNKIQNYNFVHVKTYLGVGGGGCTCELESYNGIYKFKNEKQFYFIKSLFGSLIEKNFDDYCYSGDEITDVKEAMDNYYVHYPVPGTPGANILIMIQESNFKKFILNNPEFKIEHRGWQYHAQKMVLLTEEERIDYLYNFIKENT